MVVAIAGGIHRRIIHEAHCASNFRGASEGRSHGEQSVENGTGIAWRATGSQVVLNRTRHYPVRCVVMEIT